MSNRNFILCILSGFIFGCTQQQTPANPFGASVPCTNYLNVNYAPAPPDAPICDSISGKQKFDLYVPQGGSTSKPLVIYIHGGGYIGGDKTDIASNAVLAPEVTKILNHGWAFAAINYRLLDKDCATETCGVRDKCLDDVVRCIKFIKSKAATYGIDKNRIGLLGSSAGATASLWVAFKGFESKNTPTGFGPLLDAENTDIKAVATYLPQATLDLKKWDTAIFTGIYGTANLGLTEIMDSLNSNDSCYIHAMYGMGNLFPAPLTLLNTADYRKDIDILDLLAAMSSPFPSLYIVNNKSKDNLANPLAAIINHHPLHGVKLVDVAKINSNSTGNLFYNIPIIPPPPPAGTYVSTGGYTFISNFFFAKL